MATARCSSVSMVRQARGRGARDAAQVSMTRSSAAASQGGRRRGRCRRCRSQRGGSGASFCLASMATQSSGSSIPWRWRGEGRRRRRVAPAGGRSGSVAPGAEQFPLGVAQHLLGVNGTTRCGLRRGAPPSSLLLLFSLHLLCFPPSLLWIRWRRKGGRSPGGGEGWWRGLGAPLLCARRGGTGATPGPPTIHGARALRVVWRPSSGAELGFGGARRG
jgi:hypothetical protein